MIHFSTISNPRTEDGGFGPVFCEKCDGNSSMLLEIKLDTVKFIMCNGCLLKGSKMILDGILDTVKNK